MPDEPQTPPTEAPKPVATKNYKGLAGRYRKLARDLKAKLAQAEADREDALSAFEATAAERDQLQTTPDEWRTKAEALEKKIAERDHFELFTASAEAAGIPRERHRDAYGLLGIRPESAPDAEKLGAAIGEGLKTRGWLKGETPAAPAADSRAPAPSPRAPLTPPPGAGKGPAANAVDHKPDVARDPHRAGIPGRI